MKLCSNLLMYKIATESRLMIPSNSILYTIDNNKNDDDIY